MSVDANGNNLYLGRGKVYFDRFNSSGVSQGLRFVGNCTKLEATPNVQKKEKFNSTTAAAVKLATVITQQTHDLAIELDEFTNENLALALLGSVGYITQAATAVVDESLTTSVDKTNSKIYQTVKRKIGTVSLKKSPSTALVLGTDYEILDTEAGLIRILPTGVTLTDGDTVLVSYTPTAITGTAVPKISAGAVGLIQGRLLFIGDSANGPDMECNIWKVNITPNGPLGFITDDFAAMTLTGEVLSDPNHTGELWQLINRG